MSNSPHFPKTVKGRPSIVTLHNLYHFLETLEKSREEGEAKIYEYIESLEIDRILRET